MGCINWPTGCRQIDSFFYFYTRQNNLSVLWPCSWVISWPLAIVTPSIQLIVIYYTLLVLCQAKQHICPLAMFMGDELAFDHCPPIHPFDCHLLYFEHRCVHQNSCDRYICHGCHSCISCISLHFTVVQWEPSHYITTHLKSTGWLYPHLTLSSMCTHTHQCSSI